MSKTSYVLGAFSILGLEEILKLSEVLHAKQVPLKKAAGEELIVWEDGLEKAPKKESEEARVLSFPKKSINEFSELGQDHPVLAPRAEDDPNIKKVTPSDLLLWQRELAKESEVAIQKVDAMKGYQKSTQMYVVKAETSEGKKKLRFASTDGVLVNKKQA